MNLDEIDLASRAGTSAKNIRNGKKLASARLAAMHKIPKWKRQLHRMKRESPKLGTR